MPTLADSTLNIGQEAVTQKLPGAGSSFDAANPGSGLGGFISTILSAVMVIAALMVLLNLIWGAIEWISSGGDKGKLESARNRITQSIIGIVVLASVIALFIIVQKILGINVLHFGAVDNSAYLQQQYQACINAGRTAAQCQNVF